MINYKKYELMKECLSETFEVYAATLDVSDYVPKEHLEKAHKWIYKVMRKKQREIKKEDRKYQRTLKKLIKLGWCIDTTSKEFVLGDVDPSYVNFYRAPSLLSGQLSTVASTENATPGENATSGENAMQGENAAPGENVAPTENINSAENNTSLIENITQ